MAVMKTTREVRGVGLAIPRPDGPAKVTGQTQYVADIKPQGMLYAKLLRSPHAHAFAEVLHAAGVPKGPVAPPLPRRARDEIMSPLAPATTPSTRSV